jgi:hypothetical protein
MKETEPPSETSFISGKSISNVTNYLYRSKKSFKKILGYIKCIFLVLKKEKYFYFCDTVNGDMETCSLYAKIFALYV